MSAPAKRPHDEDAIAEGDLHVMCAHRGEQCEGCDLAELCDDALPGGEVDR